MPAGLRGWQLRGCWRKLLAKPNTTWKESIACIRGLLRRAVVGTMARMGGIRLSVLSSIVIFYNPFCLLILGHCTGNISPPHTRWSQLKLLSSRRVWLHPLLRSLTHSGLVLRCGCCLPQPHLTAERSSSWINNVSPQHTCFPIPTEI